MSHYVVIEEAGMQDVPDVPELLDAAVSGSASVQRHAIDQSARALLLMLGFPFMTGTMEVGENVLARLFHIASELTTDHWRLEHGRMPKTVVTSELAAHATLSWLALVNTGVLALGDEGLYKKLFMRYGRCHAAGLLDDVRQGNISHLATPGGIVQIRRVNV